MSDTNQYEYVDHPSHYGGADNPYECIKVIEAWGLDKNFVTDEQVNRLLEAIKDGKVDEYIEDLYDKEEEL